MYARMYAQILGVVLILVGILGLILGGGLLLGILNIDIAEDTVHNIIVHVPPRSCTDHGVLSAGVGSSYTMPLQNAWRVVCTIIQAQEYLVHRAGVELLRAY